MISVTETPKGPGTGLRPWDWLEGVPVLESLSYRYRAGGVGWGREELSKAAVC